MISTVGKMLDDEQALNWCPLCGDDLKDYKKQTRYEHDMKVHPDYYEYQTGIKRNDFDIYKNKLR